MRIPSGWQGVVYDPPMANAAAGAGPTRSVGRPARIDRDAIARAVIEIGYDDATMKRVAEHLGVSVPGLYYYVRGRDDLLRLAAEYSLASAPMPVDEGQHWARWLREWARYTRSAMSEPELMDLYRDGGVDTDRMVDVIGSTLDVLCRDGFTPDQAMAAWDATSSVALGSAVADQRERALTDAGRPWFARIHATLAHRGPDEQTTLRALTASGGTTDRDEAFEERLTSMLIGLAVRFDLPIDDEVYDRPPPTHRRTSPKRR
jgi:AcrR family transcriptional regulator